VTCRAVVRHQVKMLPFHGLSFGFGGTGKTKEVSLIYRRTDSPFAEMDVPTNIVQCRRDSNPGKHGGLRSSRLRHCYHHNAIRSSTDGGWLHEFPRGSEGRGIIVPGRKAQSVSALLASSFG
jgi:hypothetical protein